jgi:hypothetical protein
VLLLQLDDLVVMHVPDLPLKVGIMLGVRSDKTGLLIRFRPCHGQQVPGVLVSAADGSEEIAGKEHKATYDSGRPKAPHTWPCAIGTGMGLATGSCRDLYLTVSLLQYSRGLTHRGLNTLESMIMAH